MTPSDPKCCSARCRLMMLAPPTATWFAVPMVVTRAASGIRPRRRLRRFVCQSLNEKTEQLV